MFSYFLVKKIGNLGSSASRCEGSSPFARTKSSSEMESFFIFRKQVKFSFKKHFIYQLLASILPERIYCRLRLQTLLLLG